jgi:Putative MetA-pathway of phenol degradation
MKPHLFATILLMPSLDVALAVSPLVTDDADTVEPAHLQLNSGWQFSRTASAPLSSLLVNPVLGLNSYGELGATFGYQWSDGPTQADGITDLLISTKWRLWHDSEDILRISARFDLKAPTGSANRGPREK